MKTTDELKVDLLKCENMIADRSIAISHAAPGSRLMHDAMDMRDYYKDKRIKILKELKGRK